MAIALYRRYRPESFAEVIGQDHVTTPLRRALRAGRIGHAYLFSGPRGCGKTTSARILARCLNCAEGPTDVPCGQCDSCRDLATGGAGSLDVVEIDAASHGGVDDARELRERASFAPVRDRYKVFIIDEAHMVTSAGFNALLKLVEEPPDHVKFVFATTEPDKVIGTIRSRTHHYPFRLIPPQVLGPYLEEVCAAESVQVGEGVMPLVVRAGGGSARDSMSVLDQLMAGAGEGGLDVATAIALLGFTDTALLDTAVTAIAQRDAAALYGAVEHVLATGHEPRRFVEDLLERMRDLIVLAAVPDKGADLLPQVPAGDLEQMRGQATMFSPADLSLCGDLVHETLSTMSGATSPRLHLELLAARLVLRNERAALAAGDGPAQVGAAAPSGAGAPVAGPAQGAPGAPGASGARDEARRIAQQKVEAARQARTGRAPVPTEPREQPAPQHAQAPVASAPAAAPAAPASTEQQSAHVPAPAAQAPSTWAPAAAAQNQPSAQQPRPEQEPPFTQQPSVPQQSSGAQQATPAQDPSGPSSAPMEQTAPQASPAAAAPDGLDAEHVRGHWSAILDELQQIRRPSWALVSQNGHVNGAHGSTLVIGFRTEGLVHAFHRGTAGENLADAVRRILHTDVSVEAVVGEDPGPGGGGSGTSGPGGPSGSNSPGARGGEGPSGPGARGDGGPSGPGDAGGPGGSRRPQAARPEPDANRPHPAPWGDAAASLPPRDTAASTASSTATSAAASSAQQAPREEPPVSLGQRASERAMAAAARASQSGRGGSGSERVEDFAPEPDDPYPPDPHDEYPPDDHGARNELPSQQAPEQRPGSGTGQERTGRWSDALHQAEADRGTAVGAAPAGPASASTAPASTAPASTALSGEIPVVDDEGRDSVSPEQPRTYGQNALKRAIAEGRVVHSRPAQTTAALTPAGSVPEGPAPSGVVAADAGGVAEEPGAPALQAVPAMGQSSAASAASANIPPHTDAASSSADAQASTATARAAASWGTAVSTTGAGTGAGTAATSTSGPGPAGPTASAIAPSAPPVSAPSTAAPLQPVPARSGAAMVREAAQAAQASRPAGQRFRGARGAQPDEAMADVDPTGGATREDADATGANRNGREVIEKLLGGKVLEVIDENRPR
ncbi:MULTISPECIES: DNA polymerase III subunit gamma and tau [unclassified Brachybacterium]|uniref:DNA polymerase III subunit gamma and tau n=1 Tax=unclassified Brachybacterium TaxID=2623841 RepID=UPI003F9226BA